MMYADFILKNAPRILTQIDRDRHSPTYGSCDRNHWHLKIRDFTSAILQQSGLTIALLYQTDFIGNIYHNNENVRDWAIATVDFWAKIQLRDGSYNEYYPHEHGFPPTAFSLYAACEISKRLNLQNELYRKKISRTAKWLAGHIESSALNQEIASITALYSAYTILHEQWILDSLEKKLQRVLALQSEDGWFPEYGGADLGYLSVSLDMLAAYYVMSGDERAKEPLEHIVNFVKYFIHPDGTVGGEYGSRNTSYFLPCGMEVMASLGNADAEAVLQKLYANTDKYNFFMDSVDDRYFSHYVLHSFLRAQELRMRRTATGRGALLPCEVQHKKIFIQSGLITIKTASYYCVVSLRKGGIIKVFDGCEEVFLDCGYRVDYGKGMVAATNWLDPAYMIAFENEKYNVSGNMNKVALKVSTPFLHMGLRVAAFLLGNKIISFLKRKIIFVDKHVDTKFERQIELKDNEIVIADSFTNMSGVIIERATNMSLRHVASGKFFMTSDLQVVKRHIIESHPMRTCIAISGDEVSVKYE